MSQKPVVLVTRKLPEAVEARLARDYQARFNPEDRLYTTAELLAQADMACHHAKARGRNQYHFYKASSREVNEMAADAGWSQRIQSALDSDGFVLHYQPIIELESGTATHYEVLLRMLLEGSKLAPPSAFLPAAERFGLMLEIDLWVIRNAIAARGIPLRAR